MTLLDQHSSVVDQSPVGPDAVCAALRELCDHDEMPASQRLGIPERVEKPLARALNQFYADLTGGVHAGRGHAEILAALGQ